MSFFIKTLNNFQPVMAETIVSKVQGGQNKSPGGQSTPWLPPMISSHVVASVASGFTSWLLQIVFSVQK